MTLLVCRVFFVFCDGNVSGIVCGHLYYYAEDVFPNLPYGYRILETPSILKRIFDPAPLPYVEIPDRPGGFNFGAQDTDRDRAFVEAQQGQDNQSDNPQDDNAQEEAN